MPNIVSENRFIDDQATSKAERLLEKAEKKEQSVLKSLYRAKNAHNIALSHVTEAQNGYEVIQ